MEDQIIEEIKESINKNSSILTSKGVTKGTAGISLFYFYYSKYKENDKYQTSLMQNLENAIEGLNNDYNGPNIVSDIIEIARLITFFCEEKILNKDDTKFYFQNFSPILLDLLFDEINKKNISPIDGAIKFGYYFLLDKKTYSKELASIVDLIKNQANYHEESQGVYWYSAFMRNDMHLIELGGFHGLSGIINFLIDVYRGGTEAENTKQLIIKALNYLLFYKDENGPSQFPFDSASVQHAKNFNLAYGDLSIGYVFLKAGKALGIEAYYKEGVNILINSSKFRDDKEDYIKDANILYGSSGLVSIYRLFKTELNTKDFDNCIEYWQEKSFAFKRHNNEWAGFESYFNLFDINTPLSLTDGLIGIGITLMSHNKGLKNFEYLNYLNYNL